MRLPAHGRSRILLAGALVLLVAGASTGVWLLTRDSSEAASSITSTVSTQTVRETVSADGTVAARKTSDESFAVSGTVQSVAVKEGDKVHKGDVLATVGKAALVASRDAASASLDAAETQLSEDQDAGASDVQLAADQTSVVAARATLADARQAVRDATLRADISGTVTAVGIAKGDSVGSSSNGANAPTGDNSDSSDATITVVSTGSYVVDATVAAADVQKLKKGLQAEVTATGVSDTVYGTVTEVGLVAQTNDSGAAVFPVTVAVTGKRDDLYAGVSATVSIIVQQREGVLTVPSRALQTKDGATYVTKVVDGKQVDTKVEVGTTYGASTEVVSGLKDGDTVVIPGFRLPTGGNQGNGGKGNDGPQFFEGPVGGQLPGGGPVTQQQGGGK